jgi:hypothetical protein
VPRVSPSQHAQPAAPLAGSGAVAKVKGRHPDQNAPCGRPDCVGVGRLAGAVGG